MIIIRIHLSANQGKQNELPQALEKLGRRIAMEVGSLGCRAFQSTGNDCEPLLIGQWEILESVQVHVASRNMSILAGAGTILTESICSDGARIRFATTALQIAVNTNHGIDIWQHIQIASFYVVRQGPGESDSRMQWHCT